MSHASVKHRPGRIDLTPLQWVILAGCASWLVVLSGVWVFNQIAAAAAGVLS